MPENESMPFDSSSGTNTEEAASTNSEPKREPFFRWSSAFGSSGSPQDGDFNFNEYIQKIQDEAAADLFVMKAGTYAHQVDPSRVPGAQFFDSSKTADKESSRGPKGKVKRGTPKATSKSASNAELRRKGVRDKANSLNRKEKKRASLDKMRPPCPDPTRADHRATSGDGADNKEPPQEKEDYAKVRARCEDEDEDGTSSKFMKVGKGKAPVEHI